MLPLIYKKVGDDYVIIASKGGFPKHPVWYLNLVDNPQCDIRVGKDIFSARARVAEGEERSRLWEELVEIYPPYTAYQEATDRVIPVVVLEV
jgi:deazaflavin-dependent oxidoreductase (nitroreductase family)